MKKLLAGVALLSFVSLWTAEKLDWKGGALPLTQAIMLQTARVDPASASLVVSTSQTSVHSTVATQSSFSWSTVDLGGAAANRKIVVLACAVGASGWPTSVALNGNAMYQMHVVNNSTNYVAAYIIEETTGTTNQTIAVTYGANVTAASIIVFRIAGCPYQASCDYQSWTVDNGSNTTYVSNNGGLIAGGLVTSSTGGATWTGVTETTDALITGTTYHTAGRADVATEETVRTIKCDTAGTVSNVAMISMSFQPTGQKPFLHFHHTYTNNSTQTVYTFSNCDLGPPGDGRVVGVVATLNCAHGRTITGIKVDGVSCTKVRSHTPNSNNNNGLAAIYVIGKPTGTFGTVEVTMSGAQWNCQIHIMSMYALSNAGAAYDEGSSKGNGSTTISVANLDYPQDGIVFAGMAHVGGDVTESINAPFFEQVEGFFDSTCSTLFAASSRVAGATGQTCTVTHGAAAINDMLVVACFR